MYGPASVLVPGIGGLPNHGDQELQLNMILASWSCPLLLHILIVQYEVTRKDCASTVDG